MEMQAMELSFWYI